MGTKVRVISDVSRKELIDDTIKMVKGEKKGWRWNQRDWGTVGDCGTAACVAGNTVHAAGYMPTQYKPTFTSRAVSPPTYAFVVRPQGKHIFSTPKLAGELLGLTNAEAEYLFSAARTKREVLHALRTLRKGKSLTGTAAYRRAAKDADLGWELRQLDGKLPCKAEHADGVGYVKA